MKVKLKQIGAGILAAFTTPEAIKAEKSLAAIIVARALLFLGASAGTAAAVEALLHALGVK